MYVHRTAKYEVYYTLTIKKFDVTIHTYSITGCHTSYKIDITDSFGSNKHA